MTRGLGRTPNVRALTLSENPLTDLTPVFQLRELRQLYLWYTGIESLAGIDRLQKLNELGVADNNIKDVSVLFNRTNLDLLFLVGNHRIPWYQLEALTKNKILDLRAPNWKDS